MEWINGGWTITTIDKWPGELVDTLTKNVLQGIHLLLPSNFDASDVQVLESYSEMLRAADAMSSSNAGTSIGEPFGDSGRKSIFPGMTDSIADAILDWVDDDDEQRRFGAEDETYSQLESHYSPSNRPLVHMDELLCIRGVTPELVYGADANRNGVIDGREDGSPDHALGWAGLIRAHGSKISSQETATLSAVDRVLLALGSAISGGEAENVSDTLSPNTVIQTTELDPTTIPTLADEQPNQPVATPTEVRDEPEMMDVAIRVNYMRRPVVGAMVHPDWYGERGGNLSTNVEPQLTDATGIATFRLKKRYGENVETRSVHVGVRHADFCYRYEHNAPIENGVVTLSLTKGYRVLVDAIDADTKTAITSDIYAGDLSDGIWHRQSDGRLLSPMLRYDEYGNRAIGLTQIRGEQVIGFSDLVPVRPIRKQQQVLATNIPIHRPVILSGELDSSVPRPVRKGRVMIVVERVQRSTSGKVSSWGPDWVDWTPISSDGTFRFDALPRGGEVSLLATCDDGFVSSSTAVAGMGEGITVGMFLGYLQPMKIQLGNENVEIKVAMRPMTSARVRVLDPQSQPVVGARVSARSHHSWNSSLGQPLFQSLRSRDMLLGREPGPSFRESPNEITADNGVATLSNMIPGSYMVTVEHPTLEMKPNPATPHVRDVDVKFPGGKVNELTIKLIPKGTTQLR